MAVYVFTGRGTVGGIHFPREQCHRIVTNVGDLIMDDVSYGVDYLVIANVNSTSSKARKARALGIPMMTYDEWMNRMRSRGFDGDPTPPTRRNPSLAECMETVLRAGAPDPYMSALNKVHLDGGIYKVLTPSTNRWRLFDGHEAALQYALSVVNGTVLPEPVQQVAEPAPEPHRPRRPLRL